MSDAATDVPSPDGLTIKQARILESYYALRQRLPGPSIGSHEILQELRRKGPAVDLPSEALIRDVLASHDLPRRRGGRPRLSSKEVAPPDDPLDASASVAPTSPASSSRSGRSSSRR
ncbi:MAG: hypothetical protein IPN17_26965 [Deltaproteobacteria bacterium]|nr:hypothetical protein [Deltaproteobacteria bacterium]